MSQIDLILEFENTVMFKFIMLQGQSTENKFADSKASFSCQRKQNHKNFLSKLPVSVEK